MTAQRRRDPIGLAIVGCGRVGRIRGRCAAAYPGTAWIGCCDVDEEKGRQLAADTGAEFFTADYRALLARPEVNAAVIATHEGDHAAILREALGHGHRVLIEKPIATNPVESAQLVEAAEAAGADLVVGYTQRFRRRWLAARELVATGHLGEITTVTTRAFINRMVGLTRLAGNEDRSLLSPMVISGTHALDTMLWVVGGEKRPVEVTARSVSKAMAGAGTQDTTFSIFTFDDGMLWSMECAWGLPENWPASTYSLEVGMVGTEGALTIDDTHADMVMASNKPLPSHRGDERYVHLLGSYPAGDVSGGQLWGPMREETNSWLARLYTGEDTPHATGAEGHRALMLTMACDLSAKRKEALALPIDPAALYAGLKG